MTETSQRPRLAWGWWAVYLLVLLFLALPGPDRTPFSGLPMATKTQLVFYPLLMLGLFCVFFRPRRNPRLIWLGALALLLGVKVVLAGFLVETGWKGRYSFVPVWNKAEKTLEPMRFYQSQRIRDYRVDRAIAFDGANFGLHFINDLPARGWEGAEFQRDKQYPLKVQWTGHVEPQRPLALTVTAEGSVSIDVDGQPIFAARDPRGAPVAVPQTAAAGPHKLVVTYEKPPEIVPAITVGGMDAAVMPAPENLARLTTSRRATMGIMLAGLLALLVLAIAFFEAYRPFSLLLLADLWERPSKLAALLFLAFFLCQGFVKSVPLRQATVELRLGDDYLTYEGQARQILYNGPMMVDRHGQGSAYYFYPFYPYGLAGAHALLGEDFGTIVAFNFACIAALGGLFWLILRRRIGENQLMLVLLVLSWIGAKHLGYYATVSYSDNLFVPLVFAALAACAAGLEHQRGSYLFLGGVFTALAAATRPSFMVFAPFFAAALLVAQPRIGFGRRIVNAVQYLFGVGAGVSPFSLRNWLITGRYVMLVTAYSTIADFLFAPEEERHMPISHGPPSPLKTVRMVYEIVSTDPPHFLWVAMRKVLFVLGSPFVGPAGNQTPNYFFIFTILFLIALWLRRIPWALGVTIVTFALSHIAAVVLGAPWTYGYKTILPLHCAFLLGIAFLLPRRSAATDAVPARDLLPAPDRSPVTVILPGSVATDAQVSLLGSMPEIASTVAVGGTGAAIRDAIFAAPGDSIVALGPGATPRSVRQLIAYRDEHDVVVGTSTGSRGTPLARRVGRLLTGGLLRVVYGVDSVLDLDAPLILIRKHAAPQLLERNYGEDAMFGTDLLLSAARARLAVAQIAITPAEPVAEDPESASRRTARTLRRSVSMWFTDLLAERRRQASAARASQT